MLGVEMYYAVKTLLDRGKNLSEISRVLGIDRKTVRKIRDRLKEGKISPPEFSRKSVLEPYKDEIIEYLSEGLSAVLIHQKLLREKEISVSYSCVKKYVRKLKGSEGVYIPLLLPPGEEAQVDFGYIGYFYNSEGKKEKYWIFCMVLSYSRYKYYEIVKSQDVKTFLNCHINAFEYFGGVPRVVKIDNLKSGVLQTNFYEAIYQREYFNMLSYYGSSPVACKVKYPQEKGKVESGIKYVKNNFFKSTKEKEVSKIKVFLLKWQEEVCNRKIHGTTRKVPYEQFIKKEKEKLLSLPPNRYEIYEIGERIVSSYSHITYQYNYYSVPYKYVGEKVTIYSNSKVLKVYNANYEEIAVHAISSSKGEFISKESHNPKLSSKDYMCKSKEIGENTYSFFKKLKEEKPYHYHRMMHGIFSLLKIYEREVVDLACKRAVEYNAISYLSVKNICEKGLYRESEESSSTAVRCGGHSSDLRKYDRISEGVSYVVNQ
jgi:transposase